MSTHLSQQSLQANLKSCFCMQRKATFFCIRQFPFHDVKHLLIGQANCAPSHQSFLSFPPTFCFFAWLLFPLGNTKDKSQGCLCSLNRHTSNTIKRGANLQVGMTSLCCGTLDFLLLYLASIESFHFLKTCRLFKARN